MKKKLVRKLLFISLLSLCSIPTFADDFGDWGENLDGEDAGNFRILTKDADGIATSGYYKSGPNYSLPLTEDKYDFILSNINKDKADELKASGKLLYTRNGYGGPYGTCGKVYHPTSWAFNILLPYTGLNTPAEIESYAYKYIPMNKTYTAGNQSKNAYGYASGVGPNGFPNIPKKSYDGYTLKYLAADPETGDYYQDTSGHILMTLQTKQLADGDYKPFFGEYRFNGISGNGERVMQQAA